MGDDEDVKSGVIDSLKTVLGIPEGPEAQKVPIDLVVHEFLPPEASTLFRLSYQCPTAAPGSRRTSSGSSWFGW
ncbi:hypothetical protein D9758_016851 [Tetrapyrgos nigripes]|uniref:Uncharacterized protein n=1 Tax=Tetrapyrgos nigripes TaxID=182062 RepID=A0A8H5CE69_9AGAR|nr:hypothetical protein D9758_016851 [Tetrapyrgos nigripes]